MIRNLPYRTKAEDVLREVDRAGFRGLYDFFYLPEPWHNKSLHRRWGSNTCLGYAFINFKDPADATRFAAQMQGNRGFGAAHSCSTKEADIRYASVQGLEDNW